MAKQPLYFYKQYRIDEWRKFQSIVSVAVPRQGRVSPTDGLERIDLFCSISHCNEPNCRDRSLVKQSRTFDLSFQFREFTTVFMNVVLSKPRCARRGNEKAKHWFSYSFSFQRLTLMSWLDPYGECEEGCMSWIEGDETSGRLNKNMFAPHLTHLWICKWSYLYCVLRRIVRNVKTVCGAIRLSFSSNRKSCWMLT